MHRSDLLQFQQFDSILWCVRAVYSDGHELAGEDHHSSVSKPRDALSSFGGEEEGNATQHKPRVVTLPEGVGKRKRGRPTGTKTVKQKPPINRSQKSRPRAAKKPAKISEYESDNDSSLNDKEEFDVSNVDSGNSKKVDYRTKAASNQPRTTRARLRSKPVGITENESDEDAAAKEQTTDNNFKLSTTNENEALKDSTSDRGKGVEQGISESSNHTQKFDKVNESGIGQSSSVQRIADNDDPIQAILMNIMPMLATTKVESAEPVRHEAKPRAADPMKEEDKEAKDAEMQTVKKRKVSYKDMANQLLKDW